MDVRRRRQRKLWMKGGGGGPGVQWRPPPIGWLSSVLNLDGGGGGRGIINKSGGRASWSRLSLARWQVLLLSALALLLFVQMPILIMPSHQANSHSYSNNNNNNKAADIDDDTDDSGATSGRLAATAQDMTPFSRPARPLGPPAVNEGGLAKDGEAGSHYRRPDCDDNQSANQSNSSSSSSSVFAAASADGAPEGSSTGRRRRLPVRPAPRGAPKPNKCPPASASGRQPPPPPWPPEAAATARGDALMAPRRRRSWLGGSSPPSSSSSFPKKPAELASGSHHADGAPIEPPPPPTKTPTDGARRLLTSGARPTGADQIMLPNNNNNHNNLIDAGELELELADDDLFLTKQSARTNGIGQSLSFASSSARARRHELAEQALETIYFGGFFPWLADEREAAGQLGAGGAAQADMINANQAARPARQSDPAANSANSNQQQQQRAGRTRPSKARKQAEKNGNNNSGKNSDSHHQLGKFILPAVRLALDHINTNQSVLAAYRLEVVARDTQCNATISLKKFFDMVYEAPKKMLLYGDACRVSTDPIAKASYFFDLIQISYADTDPIYTIENYPNFFRVVPSENALSLARIPFIRHFNWTRVGTIYQNLPRYSLPHSKLLTDLERFNIVIKQSVSLPGSVEGLHNRDLGDELRKLKEKDVRIILGNFDEQWALLLFCEAYRERMTGRKYQWILTGMNEDKLWRHYELKGSSCSKEDLLVAMDGYIVTDITPVTRSQTPTISGMMAHEYSNAYRRRAEEMNVSIEENKFYGYVYDGIWAIALALDRVDRQLRWYQRLREAGKVQLVEEMEGLGSLRDFDYHKPIWVKLIRSALNRTEFQGVTGTVSFHKNERPGLISFSQFQAFRGNSEFIIGSYDALNEHLDLKVGFPIFWRGPTPPIDYTIERVTPFRISRTLFVNMSIFALVGISLAFFFLFVNIKNRNQRFIKMSSPYLNNLIIIGCILTYTSVIILGLDSGLTSESNFPYICNARAWVLMAGFTFAFGSMFSKTFRVHSIFTNIKLHKKVIKDYKLFMVVFILLTFDICILIVWQYFDPFYRETNNGTSLQDADNEDVIIVPEMEHCQSKRMTIFLSVIYVYKGLLMAFGCFLAWETRHVSIPALNDSKYIGLSVYNVVIMCVFGVGLSLVFKDQQEISYMIISIFILWCSTLTLCLVFLPKIKMLRDLKRNPKGTDYRVRATLKTFKKNYHDDSLGAASMGGCRDIHGNLIGGRAFGVNLNERIKILLEENVKQRSTLKEKTYELEALTFKYRKVQAMIQSGQYQQALQHSNLAPAVGGQLTTSAGAAAAGGSGGGLKPALVGVGSAPSSARLVPERVSFSLLKPASGGGDRHLAAGGDPQTTPRSLSRLPLLSTASTQIIAGGTTTTSSGTQNTTELTATDYSSPRPTTTIASVGGGGGDVDGQKASRDLVEAAPACCVSAASKECRAATTRRERRRSRRSQKGRVCAEYDVCTGNNGDDDDLFTVFSYISAGGANGGVAGSPGRSSVGAGERSFNRWSEGPFCTLMVRNSNNKARNVARRVTPRVEPQETPATKRASCPDLANKLANNAAKLHQMRPQANGQGRQPSRQMSLQQPGSSRAVMEPIKGGQQSSASVPRTLSMIEYLGLDEFDLIARRHDKLLKGRQLMAATKPGRPLCCYAACTMAATCHPAATQRQLGSDQSLIHSGSQLSCSTCCSLTYDEDDDDLHDDEVSNDLCLNEEEEEEDATTSETSNPSDLCANQSSTISGDSCRSRSSTTRSSTSSLSLTADNQATTTCHHHRQHHHHNQPRGPRWRRQPLSQPQRPLKHQSDEPSSPVSSVSSSTFPNAPLASNPASDKAPNMTTKATVTATPSKQSLCTSGHLYCAPGTSEAANEAAHIDLHHHHRRRPNEGGNLEQQEESNIIKCDVLENL